MFSKDAKWSLSMFKYNIIQPLVLLDGDDTTTTQRNIEDFNWKLKIPKQETGVTTNYLNTVETNDRYERLSNSSTRPEKARLHDAYKENYTKQMWYL
ncbi:CIC_collapsed_G0022220.mRNA.1.CDS.1 [Saccharomyces cerevisiae]|nr:CIC_collapsed_G0022220.mRNA.1.CDS.1 [Saccharomyces cerevisiae]